MVACFWTQKNYSPGVQYFVQVDKSNNAFPHRYRFYLPEDQIIPVGEETWAGMREVAITAASPNEF